MTNPRSSNDPNLKAALTAWDEAGRSRDKAFDDAMEIRTALYNTASHRAYGWAAMTCGRIAAYREQVDLAEVLLTEALGRFIFVADRYGESIAVSHLAIPEVFRHNLDRGLELALTPLTSGVVLLDCDAELLHNIAAQCYWSRDEINSALLQLLKAYDLVKNTSAYYRRSAIIGNIGVILQELGERDLALVAYTEAWRLELDHCTDRGAISLNHLANLVSVNRELGDHAASIMHAELLLEYLTAAPASASWVFFEHASEAFAVHGDTERAKLCLDRSRSLAQMNPTPLSVAAIQIGEATLMEARREFHAAIALAMTIVDQPIGTVKRVNHRYAGMVLARSYAALGRKSESERWRKFAAETGREKLLGSILSSHIRASLQVEQPTHPLTDQELTCLSLSAHGQTSADIALKLGLKTRTVNFHFTKILRKLNAMNRQEAIAKASAANLLRRL